MTPLRLAGVVVLAVLVSAPAAHAQLLSLIHI